MLALARKKVAESQLENVEALHEMDAEKTEFEDGRFDIAVAMFVASVVPNPRLLFAEMRRVVRPGGYMLFVNHFAAERGPRWVDRTRAGPGLAQARLASGLRVRRVAEPGRSRQGSIFASAPAGAIHFGVPPQLAKTSSRCAALLLIWRGGSDTPCDAARAGRER